LAEPGGVCIQGAAYETVPQRLPFEFKSLGEQQVKGFEEPVRAYAVTQKAGEGVHAPEPSHAAVKASRKHASNSRLTLGAIGLLSTIGILLAWWQPWVTSEEPTSNEQSATRSDAQPSIAVLPFQTLSEEPNQDYFSDGVTNDIITDLSKFSNLLVIAANSVFVYKGKPVNIKEVGRELGVRYVLEGSIQKAAGSVRINAQLIDATTDHHIWAERYDFALDDVFKVQDEITSTVVSSLHVILTEDEQSRVAIRHTDVIEAYDLYLRGRTFLRGTKRTHLKARELFDKAIKLDPEFAAAHAEKSFTYFSSFIMPMSRDPKVVKAALVAAERAVELDDALPLAYARLAWAYFATRQHAKAVTAARRAVALGPNDAEANVQLGNILNWSGKPDEGRQYVEKAIRLNPHHPYYYLFYLGQSYYLKGENDKAIELMKRVVTRAPYFLPVRRHLAVLYSEKGMIKEAKAETKEVLRIFPGASIEDERARCFYRWTPDVLKRFFTGLRKSGMPEGKIGEEPISM
jgi:adenylate cyclase